MACLTWFIFVKLYKESVEETIKANVAIGGQEWDNVTQAEATSSSVCLTQEGKLLLKIIKICVKS